MTKIRWGEPDPEEEIWYKACEGEGCITIMELPFQGYKNTRYCASCGERIKQEERRKWMKRKREEAREFAYGDSVSFDTIQR